jgi:hypothetical protein
MREFSTSFLARSSKIESSELGYAQPTFPFNILPGRAEIFCRDFTGYALERCKTDVKARTQLFIALAAVFGLVILCVLLMTILTCIRRIKARSRLARTPLPSAASQQISGVFTSAWKKKDGCDLENKLPGRGIIAGRPRSGEDAVEVEEQGIADRDVPVTLDGMTDGWMQLIRQRTNMVRNFVVSWRFTDIFFSSNCLATLHLSEHSTTCFIALYLLHPASHL